MKNKIIFILSLVLGLMMINGGLNKIFEYIPVSDQVPQSLIDLMTALKAISWLMPLIAVAEIIGGLLVIIPKTRALGLIILFPIVVGILLAHIVDDPSGLAVGIVFMAIECYLIWEHRDRYLPMVG